MEALVPTKAPHKFSTQANEAQLKAIETTEGPLLIIAGPGSGKTFTLVERIVYLSDLVAGKTVLVGYQKLDRYQRVVGKVLLDGTDMNLEQIKAGMAWHYKKYQGEQSVDDRVAYTDAEMNARRAKLGLWIDNNPIAPWDYRKAKRSMMQDLQPFMDDSKVK